MNDKIKAAIAANPIASATIAARERSGDQTIGTHVKQGRFQIIRVVYAKNGTSTVTPLSDWLSGPDLIKALNAIQ